MTSRRDVPSRASLPVAFWRALLAGLLALAATASPAADGSRRAPRASTQDADAPLVRALAAAAHPVAGAANDYDGLLAAIGDARIVLLGEDTHGTHEHYVERARITERLVRERGFAALVIEGDGVPAAIASRALETPGSDFRIEHALAAFDRFPLWMWRNDEFVALLARLRAINLERGGEGARVMLAGMDLYDLARPAALVVDHLEGVDMRLADAARERYACFAAIDWDPQRYGEILERSGDGCASGVEETLAVLARLPAPAAEEEPGASTRFAALQAARALVAAEAYFRALAANDGDRSWNVRDAHMAASVTLLLSELDRLAAERWRPPARVVVWAHNAHVGDARATARGATGGWTLGQLLRERFPGSVFSVGFTTATGTVYAATEWGEPGTVKKLAPPLTGSHAALLARTGVGSFYVVFAEAPLVARALREPRPQRGIGVRYLPAIERTGHYYTARLAEQYDAVAHIGRTTALHPRVSR
jgi:erythromycin esterase-like protein